MMTRDTLAFRTLLNVARMRTNVDEARCRLVLEFLSTAGAVQIALHRDLSEIELTELKLGVLVVLFMLDPAPSRPADLAAHTGVTRSAITDALDQLQAQALIRRQRDTEDRRLIHIRLTTAGRKAADVALNRYLENVGRIARYVKPHTEPPLLALCAQLNEGSTRLSLKG